MATIGKAARLSGINIETIRYYEREGIVPAPARSAGGRRMYSAEQVDVLVFVKRCRDLGFPLSDIKAMLSLRTAKGEQCDEVRAIAERHIGNVHAKIADLQRLECALVQLVAECREGRMYCPALEGLFSR